MKITATDNAAVPTGEYIAQVVDIQLEDGSYGPQFRWRFDILKPERFNDKSLVGWTSASSSLKGKFVEWAGACHGRKIRPRETVDTDTLIGAQVILVVIVKKGKDDSEFNRIEAIKPYISGSVSFDKNDDKDPFDD